MASAALGGTYTLSAEGAAQLADLAEAGAASMPSEGFTSRRPSTSSDARGRLTTLEGMLEKRSARSA